MTPDQILMFDLGTDAIKYLERALIDVDVVTRAQVTADFLSGQPLEVRVRMWSKGTPPAFSVLLIGKDGKAQELHSAGGAA